MDNQDIKKAVAGILVDIAVRDEVIRRACHEHAELNTRLSAIRTNCEHEFVRGMCKICEGLRGK